jgi:hypothetical protein
MSLQKRASQRRAAGAWDYPVPKEPTQTKKVQAIFEGTGGMRTVRMCILL